MSHTSYSVGSESNQSLESGLSQPTNTVTNSETTSISSKVSGNTTQRYNGNTGEESSTGQGFHQAAQGAEVFSAKGTPKSFIDSPSDLLNYQGMSVQAQTLENMGILKQNSMGRYDFVEQAATPEQQEQEQVTADLHDSFQMSEQENNEINTLIPEGIEHGQMQAITNRAMEAAVSGDLSKTITALSQSSGQSPAEATATVNKVVETFTRASNRYLEQTVGMTKSDIPEFYEWAKVHAPSDLKAAINNVVSTNNFKSMGQLVGQWSMANPPSEHTLNAAGYKTGKASDGSITIFIKGKEISVAAAARARLI
jgi:hypothetical protein